MAIGLVAFCYSMLAVGCVGVGEDNTGNDPIDDAGSDTDTDTDSDTDTDTDTGDDPTEGAVLNGKVWSPTGEVPISGALVYLTSDDVPVIPGEAYCYDCDDMTGKDWTLSESDGSWIIEDVPDGEWTIVTRKGFFQRQRTVTVAGEEELEIPEEHTTLPALNSGDGLDQIPLYAVILAEWDRTQDLLAKLGLGSVDVQGHLEYGTEVFDAYDDAEAAGYPASATLFTTQDDLNAYHMVFLPCESNYNGVPFVLDQTQKLRNYVESGGKMYNSCCASLWLESSFPVPIDFYGGMGTTDPTNVFDVGRIDTVAYTTTGNVQDSEMRDWLSGVTGLNVNSFPFTDGYVKIEQTVDVDNGMGLEEDNYWVKPYIWVVDNMAYSGSPLMVTFNFGCGKVFYSVYETSQAASATLTPQELALLYVILEVGVCEGEYEPPE
jgi:hypothetical protein